MNHQFEPSRLVAARCLRGKTQKELAEVLQFSPQHLCQLELGEKTPNTLTVERLAAVLEFPVAFFHGDAVEPVSPEAVSFRARRSMSAKVRDIGLGFTTVAASVVTPDLKNRFTLPPVNVPDLMSHSPENAASILRSQWNLGNGPITNMVHLLESQGVHAFWLQHGDLKMDAISLWRDEQPYVMFNQMKEAGDRGRFDAAHELGHLVLHRHAAELGTKQNEDEANLFASAFLLPVDPVGIDLPETPDFEKLYQLKKKWLVSLQALVMRGKQIGKYSDWQVRQVYQRLYATGTRIQERVFIPREQSKLHSKIFSALNAKGVTPKIYASQLALDPRIIHELMPVSTNFPPNPTQLGKEIKRGHLRLLP